MTTARPALDPELRELLADMPLMSQLTPELLAQLRQLPSTPVESLLAHRQVERRDMTVSAKDGAQIGLSVLSPARTDPTTPAAPCIYWIHGGGMVMGDRFSQIDIPLEWLDRFGAVVVTVDYRLAPEATGTTLVDDCYQGLLWIAEHADELGIDAARIIVAGASAGGGLASRRHPLGPRSRHPGDRCAGADLPHARPPQRHHLQPPVLRRSRCLDRRDERVRMARRPRRPHRRGDTRVRLTRAGRRPLGPADHLYRHRLLRGLPRRGHRLRHPRLGGRMARPNCTSGRAASTASTRCSRRHRSRPRPAAPAPTGSPVSCPVSAEGAVRSPCPDR